MPTLLIAADVGHREVEGVAIGIEYQNWMNKLGDKDTDESAVRALFVWKL